MREAVSGLKERPDYLLCDGIVTLPVSIFHKNYIVKGDALSLSIAAASILAKVERDRLISSLDLEYPGYDSEEKQRLWHNEPSERHQCVWGRLPYHRRTFRESDIKIKIVGCQICILFLSSWRAIQHGFETKPKC